MSDFAKYEELQRLNMLILKWIEGYNPRMTRYLCQEKTFSDRKVLFVDVGARGLGGNERLAVYGDQMEVIGFEPDKKECQRLNQLLNDKGWRFFPVALHRDRKKREFYITAYNQSCGFYHWDTFYMSRFPDEANVKVESIVEMDTTDFDSFAHEYGIEWMDFMKIDVEGAELDVLNGGEDYLSNGVLGVKVEVRFHEYSHQPVFNEIDAYLRDLGFRLFDLDIYRHGRKVLPEVFRHKNDKGHLVPGPTKKGQVIWADALYFRDAVAEIRTGDISKWDKNRILKLATLFEIHNLSDCAIELLQECKKDILTGVDVGHLIDLLTPPFRGKYIPYKEYIKEISAGKDPESLNNKLFKAFKQIFVFYAPAWMKSLVKSTLKILPK